MAAPYPSLRLPTPGALAEWLRSGLQSNPLGQRGSAWASSFARSAAGFRVARITPDPRRFPAFRALVPIALGMESATSAFTRKR